MAIRSDGDSPSAGFAKGVRGVPHESGLTDQQMQLKIAGRHTQAISELTTQLRNAQAAPPEIHIASPVVNVAPPAVNIDLSEVSEGLQAIGGTLRDMGSTARLSLKEARLQNGQLGDINYSTREGLRCSAISMLLDGQTLEVTKNIDGKLGYVVEAERALLESLEEIGLTGHAVLERMDVNNEQLSNLNEKALMAYHQRNIAIQQAAIEIGIQEQALGKLDRIRESVAHLEHSIISALAAIGGSIKGLSTQLAISTLKLTDAISHFEGVFQENANVQNGYLEHILDELSRSKTALENPAATKSFELWRLGEVARKAKQVDDAKSLFDDGIKANPTYSQNYFSLAVILFDENLYAEATKLLKKGIAYSSDDPKSKAGMLYLRAKIERKLGNIDEGISLGEHAATIDPKNLDTWYELAYLYATSGDEEQAVFFMKNLYLASKAKNLSYHYKMFATPIFFPYIDRVESAHSIKHMPTGKHEAKDLDLAVSYLGDEGLDMYVRPDAMLEETRSILADINEEMSAIRAELASIFGKIEFFLPVDMEDKKGNGMRGEKRDREDELWFAKRDVGKKKERHVEMGKIIEELRISQKTAAYNEYVRLETRATRMGEMIESLKRLRPTGLVEDDRKLFIDIVETSEDSAVEIKNERDVDSAEHMSPLLATRIKKEGFFKRYIRTRKHKNFQREAIRALIMEKEKERGYLLDRLNHSYRGAMWNDEDFGCLEEKEPELDQAYKDIGVLEREIASDEAAISKMESAITSLNEQIRIHEERYKGDNVKWKAQRAENLPQLREQYDKHPGHQRIEELAEYYSRLVQQIAVITRVALDVR